MSGFLKIVDQSGNKIPTSQFLNSYEGASSSRRLGSWGTSSAGPNAALFSSLSTLRARSREFSRNNPLASGAIDSFVANLIGSGITPRWQIEDSGLKKEVQELWSDWVRECDAAEACDFYGLQSLVARSMIDCGEALALHRMRRPEDNLSVPYQIQLLESDHLDEAYNTVAPNKNEIRMGIEINGRAQRVAYWLFKEHPGETFLNADTTERIRVPASEVMHVYRLMRIGQMRGRPWLAPTIVKMHDIDQCDDAELVRRKTTAMFGGFISEPFTDGEELPIGNSDGIDSEGREIIALEPGTFPILPKGMEVTFSEPKDISGNYIAWMKQNLRSVAKGIGITYEQLTGDLEGVNYSSIRAGLLEFRRLCKTIQSQTLVFKFCQPVAARFLDTAVLSGVIKIKDYLKNRRKYLRIQWMPDGWDWVDPVKDQKADMMEIRNGLSTRTRKIAERGGDIEVVDAERAEENKRADALGLMFDTDPRKTTSSGLYQDKGDEKTT